MYIKEYPVVTTDVDGNAELVLHNETGVVVPADSTDAIAEAIIKILEDKKGQNDGAKGEGENRALF